MTALFTPTDPASGGSAVRPDGRLEWMDLLRGIAVALVIVWHSAAILMLFDLTVPTWLVDANDVFAPYRMPTLMVLSGMLLNRSLAKPVRVYGWGKVANLVWPWLLWTVVNWLVLQYEEPLWDRTVWAKSYLWFLYYLVILYALAPLVRRVPAWALVALPWAATLAAPTMDAQRFLFLAGFFFLGRMADEHRDVVERITSSRRAWWALPIAVAFSVAFALWGPWRYEGALAIFSVLGIVTLIRIARMPAISERARALRWIGRNSVVFYVSHFPVIVAVVTFSGVVGLPVGATIPLGFAAAVLIGGMLAAGRRFRPIALLFALPVRSEKRDSTGRLDRMVSAASGSLIGRWAIPAAGMIALGVVAVRLT